MDILNKVKRFREEENKLKWEGTFAEYLAIVKERKEVAQTAHSRVYNMIKSSGLVEKDGNRLYQFFGEEIFGLEESIERLVEEYFHPAAKRLEVRKRILLLMGLKTIPKQMRVRFMPSKAVRCMKIHFI
jgi:serine protein kinase